MGWNCKACTFLNTVESLNKCAICETARSTVSLTKGDACGKTSANENGNKKRSREAKSTVQATLFGGIAPNAGSRILKDKKSKCSSDIVIAKPNRSFTLTRPPPSASSGTTDRFEIWKRTAKNDIPFPQLEERTRTAMKQIFCVEKLRFLQPKAVKSALKRKSQIVVMATGGGM